MQQKLDEVAAGLARKQLFKMVDEDALSVAHVRMVELLAVASLVAAANVRCFCVRQL